MSNAISGREYPEQMVHYFRKRFTYTDALAVLSLGWLPPGGLVLRAGVAVIEVFNAGTNNRLDIGTSGDDDGFATDLSLLTIGNIVADEMATTNDQYSAAGIELTATVDVTGSAASTGIAIIWVEFIVNNDQ